MRKVITGMEEQELLTFASAMAFQVLTSLIPLALLVLSIMGFLHLDDVWTKELAPQVAERVSVNVFGVVDDVARHTLGSRRGWWLTLGVVFTLWQISGVARAVMGALSRVYGDGDDRSFARRYAISVALGLAVAVCVLGALVVVRFGAPLLGLEDVGWAASVALLVLRWGAALALLTTAVWVLLRFAPAHPGPHRWVSFGSALCVVAWVGHVDRLRLLRDRRGRLRLDLRLARDGVPAHDLPVRVGVRVPDRRRGRRDRAPWRDRLAQREPSQRPDAALNAARFGVGRPPVQPTREVARWARPPATS